MESSPALRSPFPVHGSLSLVHNSASPHWCSSIAISPGHLPLPALQPRLAPFF